MSDKLKIGYVPYSADLSHPGDRRRIGTWSKTRRNDLQLEDPTESDLLVLSAAANFDFWINKSKQPVILDLVDGYLGEEPLFIRDLLRQWQPQSLMFPVESTERWRHGWNVGVMVVPNDVGAKNFIDWFENKPAEVIECDGSLLTVQFLKLRRHDGDICQLAYGNWVEENQ